MQQWRWQIGEPSLSFSHVLKDFLKNPFVIDSYSHKYVLLVDSSRDLSNQNLLIAIEQMENRGWMLHNITHSVGPGGSNFMRALMCRKH